MRFTALAGIALALTVAVSSPAADLVLDGNKWRPKMGCLDTGLASKAGRECSSTRVETIYFLPPASCTHGPLPAYKIVPATLNELRKLLADASGIPLRAFNGVKVLEFTVPETATVYIRKDIVKLGPSPTDDAETNVYDDIVSHGEAHLRGCEHRF